MPGPHPAQDRRLVAAAREGIGAAGVKVAAGRRIYPARHVAANITRLRVLALALGIGTAVSNASV
jgi:hypothetical protein